MRRLALLTAVALAASAAGAEAQSARCRVMDPTGTPLNIRDSPNGAVLGQVRNGTLVERVRIASDDRGRPWAYIIDRNSGEPLGWVIREFIACF
ncbi:SH3 domain-containing protein [Phreatobacter aquaticus]|uniref:SH3 domain-containing protein n=1 Tax=Phreatobacter aquaticus TaxID=2570229 RepID=A0A4D7QKV5_9HYPH|nr:SH3 domain-containing protein [Phreatobacter aquaticus]QCK88330.1 SH3 domain-containing protein [Phreatobacter aquaticus]